MRKLWGRISSINVQKVVWCLDELGLAYQRVDAGGRFGVVDTPEYARLNPNRLVPVFEDEGFVLWESNAIVRYLGLRYSSGGLCPVDPLVRADADRWMDWQACELSSAMRDAFMQLIRTPESDRDPERIAESLRQTERRMAMLEARLADRPFVAGAHFTMGDIPVGCAVHRWFNLPAVVQPRPNLRAWYERLRARPGAQRVLSLAIA